MHLREFHVRDKAINYTSLNVSPNTISREKSIKLFFYGKQLLFLGSYSVYMANIIGLLGLT